MTTAFQRFRGSGPIDGAENNLLVKEVDVLRDPRGYRASPELANAVNVALALKMPLLVTGDPGTGKMQLAFRLALELGLTEVLRYNTKSSSQANDLYYSFDSVRQFGQSQLNAARKEELPDARDFIQFSAMGYAILRTLEPDWVEEKLGRKFRHARPTSSVVVIDEIDKAPRDFPNDLLNQIEDREFFVHELRQTFKADKNPDLAPVVIITSNSEKQLPEPFLRRCVYHHIEFPQDKDEIEAILGERLKQLHLEGVAYQDALAFFFKLREQGALSKKPSTSELLDWLRALSNAGLVMEKALNEQRLLFESCLGTLLKTTEDLKIAKSLLA
jgi:MoxR-like ATPase